MKIAVLGASGRMGRRVVRLLHGAPDLELVAALGRGSALGQDSGELAGIGPNGVPIRSGTLNGAQVVIDFALPEATLAILPLLQGAALVTGVTGLTEAQRAELYAYDGPLIHAANFSTGVNLLLALVAQAAAALPEYDLEVLEAHHSGKVDAPSGTALALAEAAADARGWSLDAVRTDGRRGHSPRPAQQIGLHAIRAGGIVGEHEIWLGSAEETLKLCHSAGSRDTFAAGAIRAARWLHGRPTGRYTMRQVLDL